MAELSNTVYEYLTEDAEERACETIPDSDCRYVPENYSYNVANGTLSKWAEKIISPNLTLPWILNFFGAPAFLIGMLVPIKDAGSLLPQLFVSGKIRKFSIRKHFWVGASAVQALCMLIAGLLVQFTSFDGISYLIVVLLAIFSVASGVASVAFKDVSAKTVPKGQRGQMLSFRSTFGGVMALISGLFLIFTIRENAGRETYATLFYAAALLWAGASFMFSLIKEKAGSTKGGRNPAQEVKYGWHLLKDDQGFRNFIITRALLMAIPLLQPFYVLISKSGAEIQISYVGYLVAVSALAQVVSSPAWGRIADRASTKLMRIAAFIALFGIAVAIYLFLNGPAEDRFYYFIPVFFINGIAYAGARLSRKTYLVDYAPDDERPTYVSVANTLIGIFTLMAATFGFVAEIFGLLGQLLFFALMLIACITLSFRLKKVSHNG